MKKNVLFKILCFLLCFISTSCTLVGCKIESDNNSTFTLKTYDVKYLENCSIKAFSQSKSSSVSYAITPAGFDLDELNVKGYKMTITISYSVKYKRSWDILGYFGAPTYDLTALTSDLIGLQKSNLSTSKTAKNKSYSYTVDIVNIMNSKIALTFSTSNIQNFIYFSNIKVTYNCTK